MYKELVIEMSFFHIKITAITIFTLQVHWFFPAPQDKPLIHSLVWTDCVHPDPPLELALFSTGILWKW